ncbi:MAG: aminoacyl-tRNA hydrolase [Patescibacteria group bacterium]
MKLICGLGNYGEHFENTRHNVGFFYLDKLCQSLDVEGRVQDKYKSWIGKRVVENETVFFVKPVTYINSSGKVLKSLYHTFKYELEDLLLIHDDLDLSLGTYKLQRRRSSAGHRGVQSVIDALSSNDFWRLRVGIGRPSKDSTPKEYVLEKFSAEERAVLEDLYAEELESAVEGWLTRF